MENHTTKTEQTKLIDIDKIILSKSPKLYKALPKFIIRYIKKTIHQEDLNILIQKNKGASGEKFLKQTFSNFEIHSELINEENFPAASNYIFVSNHPIGSFDGLLIINTLFLKYGKVKAVVNDILLNLKSLDKFFIGVNKHGTTQREQVENLNKIFESNIPIFFFPAGLVSRKTKGVVTDGEWKKTFVSRAIKHKRDIVPIYIDGTLSKKFYRIANVRKFLRIKANLEMFYLVDEGVKQKGKTLKITIGKVISHTKLNKSKNHQSWAQEIKKHVYNMAKNADPAF